MAKKLDYSGPNRPGRSSPAGRQQTFRGHVVPQGDRAVKRAEWKRQLEEEDARKEWFIPLVILGACSLIWLVLGLIFGGIEGMAAMGGIFLFLAVINAIVGVVAAYMTVGLFGASFGNFLPAVLKLAAASTTANTASQLLPIGCFSIIVYVGVLIVMVQVLFDLDSGDAKWFTFLFVIVQLAAWVGVSYLLADYIAV